MTIVLAFEFALWLSALTVKYRDIRHALPFVLQLWMFLTPIVYPLSLVPVRWRWVMYINPLTGIVEGIRAVFTGQELNWAALISTIVVMVLMLFLSIHIFRRIEKSFADLI
jgi:lipopolysaccharide transport system permease protein